MLPLSLLILVGLFAVQSRGTGVVAAWFGPITSVWFVALAIGGGVHIIGNPAILAALSPIHGIRFLLGHGLAGLVALGAVFLAVTGSEALYADMGHFGRKPIQFAWVAFVLPGAGDQLSRAGGAASGATRASSKARSILLYPGWARAADGGAGDDGDDHRLQAVITGAFSLTQQAIQLGLMPRFEIVRTSETAKGQIYMPRINLFMLVAVVFLVSCSKSSDALAAAYGIAVTGTMVVTAILGFFVLWKCWRWSLAASALLIAPFLVIDLFFLGANMLKWRTAAGCR